MNPRESVLARYGFALLLPLFATIVALNRPALAESSWFLFFGAVILSACFGGLPPACITAALSIVLIRLFFITPALSLDLVASVSGTEQMAVFVLFALAAACLVSGLKRQRDEALDAALPVDLLADIHSSPVMITDETCRILFVNRAAERLFGLKSALVGGDLDTLLPNQSVRHHLRTVNEDTRKQPMPLQISARTDHCDLSLSLSLARVTHQGRNLFAAVFSEMTSAARAQAA